MDHVAGSPIVLSDRHRTGRVTLCGCGVVSLHLGGTSLRMDVATLAELERLLRSAVGELYALSLALKEEKTAMSSSMTH